jgi:purine-binding chemotaxis protein CheW
MNKNGRVMPRGRKLKKTHAEKPAELAELAIAQPIPETVRSEVQDAPSESTNVAPSESTDPPSRLAEGGPGEPSQEISPFGEALEFLAFKLSDEEYAVELLKITEIIRLPEITPVPRTPRTIRGIISLRGTIVPVFDLRIPLGLKDLPATRKTRIVVVVSEKGAIGLWVDEVSEVVKIGADVIEPPPSVVGGTDAEHLKGVARFKGRLLILLDLEKALLLGQ